jgi:hypothetical protein
MYKNWPIPTANLGASTVFRVLGFGVPQLLDYYLKEKGTVKASFR